MQAATGLWALLFGDQRLSWDDLPWLRSLISLPLLLKGICAAEDARRAVGAGVGGLWCSNHGGRQANGGLPALDCLPGVVDAAGDVPGIFDSGVRSGADVMTARALGARAVTIGRPYAYGLAIGGQAGIEHVLRCILPEGSCKVRGQPPAPVRKIKIFSRNEPWRLPCHSPGYAASCRYLPAGAGSLD